MANQSPDVFGRLATMVTVLKKAGYRQPNNNKKCVFCNFFAAALGGQNGICQFHGMPVNGNMTCDFFAF